MKSLFSGYQETSQVLTPLENDAWTADAVLQFLSPTRTKREELTPVDKLMSMLNLPLFTSQTLLTPVTDHNPSLSNKTTETPATLTSKTSPDQPKYPEHLDGSLGLFTIVMCALLVSCCAGIAYCHKKQEDETVLLERTIASTTEYSMPIPFSPEDDLPTYEEAAAPPTYDEVLKNLEDKPQRP